MWKTITMLEIITYFTLSSVKSWTWVRIIAEASIRCQPRWKLSTDLMFVFGFNTIFAFFLHIKICHKQNKNIKKSDSNLFLNTFIILKQPCNKEIDLRWTGALQKFWRQITSKWGNERQDFFFYKMALDTTGLLGIKRL